MLFLLWEIRPASAPADTVQQQRARLPPPATCRDPIAGEWKSLDWDERFYEWTEFTLEIRRTNPDATGPEKNQLKGFIYNHSWYGPHENSQPGPCDGSLRFRISMDAVGTVDDNLNLAFGGIGRWRLDEVICGTWNIGYNLDNFTGTIDAEIQEFQSVNNDGGRAVNDPSVFRRIKCYDEGPEEVDEGPHIAVTPPSFYPPEDEARGCGFSAEPAR